MQEPIHASAKKIPVRHRHRERNIALIILGLLLLFLIVAVIMNMNVIRLLLHPENIDINGLQDALPAVRQLEKEKKISGLTVSLLEDELTTEIRFSSLDGSVDVNAYFLEDDFHKLTGIILSEKSTISTINEAKNLAADLLGPFLSNDEIQAILLTFSPSIIAQAGQEYMDMALTLGERYDATIIGNPYKTVQFTTLARDIS